MAFTIPDQGEGDNDVQSVLFQEDLDIVIAGLSGIDCVLSGLAVTGGADMTPAVAKGAVMSNRTLFAVAAADVTIGTADATNPRIDLIVVNSSGALAVRAGTAAASPRPPARSANDVVIAMVYVPANDTAIATSQIIDKRVSPSRPQTIFKRTSNTATNTSTAEISVFDVTIPDGLLAAGNMVRGFVGGTFLANSGTPTLRLEISYGGVNLLVDTSAATTADADRHSWQCWFTLTSEADADQKLNGVFYLSPLGAKTAPTTGRVFDFIATPLISPFSGALGTVDSNTGDRQLLMTLQMNVSNVADEVDVEYATLELM